MTPSGHRVTVSVPTQRRSKPWAALLEQRNAAGGVVTEADRQLDAAMAEACREHRQRVLLSTAFGSWRRWMRGATCPLTPKGFDQKQATVVP